MGEGVSYILDPHITLTHTDLLTRDDLVIVNCAVDGLAGEPFFLLRYQGTGSKNISILTKRMSMSNHRWIYSAVLRVPDEGIIICQVTDMFGRYTVQKSIHIAGMLFVAQTVTPLT